MPDFRKHFTANSPADFRSVSVEIGDLGATWQRLTNLPETGRDSWCIEGWLARPDDEGPLPTGASPDVGIPYVQQRDAHGRFR